MEMKFARPVFALTFLALSASGKGTRRRTKSRRKSRTAANGAGQELRVSKDQAILPE